MESFKKILIIRLSAVGDVIRTIPAVKALKSYYPLSKISWVVEEPSKALLESQPEIDNVIIFPRKRWLNGLRSFLNAPKIISEAFEFILKIRQERFDIVFDFHGILKSGLISFLSSSPKRIGYDRNSTKEFNFLFSNIKVNLFEERISRFHKNMKLLKGIGLEIDDYKFEFNIPSGDREYIESFFSSLSPPSKPIIAIHPGTSAKTIYKRWMSDRYAQLADRLIEDLGSTVIFTWGPDEIELVDMIMRMVRGKVILAPETKSLTTLGELIRRCDLYIGGDTGPMHIASIVGTPVVVIYGPTDPIINEPFGLHRKVRREVGCNPCRNRSCQKLICLKRITVEDVMKAAEELLTLNKINRR